VLELTLRMAKECGCVGLVVDSKPGAVKFYEGYGFVPLEVIAGESGARPAPTALFLAVRQIEAARRKP
jgi:hypothetical protein